MTKLISIGFVAFLLSFSTVAVPADTTYHHSVDSVHYQSRKFDQQKINQFKADPDYRYGRPAEGLSWWDRILFVIFGLVGKILELATQTILGQIIFYGLCAWLVVYVVLKLLNVDARDLFFRRSARSIDFKIALEDIHALDFEKLIGDAVDGQHYRNAVRLVFLFSLKKLSDASLIQWMPGKTNDEYLKELQHHPSRQHLQELRYYFDYSWYGHFDITGQTFASIQNVFGKFNDTLK